MSDPTIAEPPAAQSTQLRKKRLTLSYALLTIILYTILFPYVRLLPIPSDVQPNFILAIIVFGPFILTIRRNELILLLTITFFLILYTIPDPSFQILRPWASYLTPPLVLIFTRNLLSEETGRIAIDTILKHSFYLWVGFGVLQFVSNSRLLVLTFRADTTVERGWMSFSGEPSAFATVLFLFAAYFLAHRNYRLLVVAFATTAIVAQSTLGILYFVILAAAYQAVRVRRLFIWLASITFAALIVIYTIDVNEMIKKLPDGQRIITLFEMALRGDELLDDMSIYSRVSDLRAAYEALATPLGNGFNNNFRLKSGWGAYIFELGWLGIGLTVSWIGFFLLRARYVGLDVLASVGAIVVVLFSSTPLAMPMATFIIAALIYSPPVEIVKIRNT